MSGEIVNLRRVKKLRAREAAARETDRARALHGRTKQQRASDAASRQAAERTLDQARIDVPDQP